MRNEIALIALEEALHETYGDLASACKQLKAKVSDVHRWMAADPEVASRIKTAQALAWGGLEGVAHQRAVVGVEEPVYQKGELVGYKTVYSDSLLALMLKARVPGYKPEVQGGSGMTVNVAILPRADTYEEWLVQRDQTLQIPGQRYNDIQPVVDGEYVELEKQTNRLRDVL